MPITVNQEQLQPCSVALKIEVPAEDAARVMNRVYRRWAKRTQVPGFRAGKAPKRLLEKAMPMDQVRATALEQIIRDSYHEALHQTDIEPFADPQFDLPEDGWDGESAVEYTATIPLRPHVTVGSLEGYHARRLQPPVTDEDVEGELERLRLGAAHYQETEQPAGPEDQVRVRLTVTMDDQEVPGSASQEPFWLQLGENLKDVDENLVGIQPNEERDFTITYPDDWDNEELRGKEASAHAHCLAVRRRVEPELDDAFAQTQGAENMDDLRQRIRHDLEQGAAQLADESLESDLIAELIRRSEISYPEQMVDRRRAEIMAIRLRQLEAQGLSLDLFLQRREISLPDLEREDAEHAREYLDRQLVLNELARAANITVEEADVEAELARQAEARGLPVEELRTVLTERNELETLRGRAHYRRAVAYLKSQATIEEVTH